MTQQRKLVRPQSPRPQERHDFEDYTMIGSGAIDPDFDRTTEYTDYLTERLRERGEF